VRPAITAVNDAALAPNKHLSAARCLELCWFQDTKTKTIMTKTT